MFQGTLVALVTPMKAGTNEVDYEALSRLVEWQIENRSDGLVILGTTGESPTIEDSERAEIIKRVVDQVDRRVPVIVGTGANATRHAIDLTIQAKSLGADAALVVTPYYNRPTQEGLYQHYYSIAESVPMPLILYNVPARTGCDLLPETIKQLSELENVVAVKEASGDLERLQRLVNYKCDIDLLTGVDQNTKDFVLQGGHGVISVIANILPAQTREMVEAAKAGDAVKADEIDKNMQALVDFMFIESNPIPAKWALQEMGLIENGIRLPLTPLSKKFHNDLRAVMQQVGLPV